MDSTTVAIAPVVAERVEEMNAYAVPAMYEVPHVNGQFNKNPNYPDWGANSYSESRRRPVRGAKPHHSRRSHPQAAWTSPECVPVQSPQWQPQSPPVSFQQEQGGPIAVNLQGLPAALCRQNFLEAMLDQAGLADDIQGCVLGEEQDAGKAVIYLANYSAALKCVQHFGGRRWANAGPAVTATVAEGQDSPQSVPASPVVVAVAVAVSPQAVGGRSPTSQRNNGAGARKQRTPKNGPEQLNLPPSALAFPGAWVMPQPALPIMAVQQDYHQASGYCQETAAGNNSPKSTGSNGSNSPKTTRWADLADDDQEDLSDRLSESVEGSTSAGSTGRTRQETGESFFLGTCDVDTDDGF